MRYLTTLLDLAGATGLAVAAAFAFDWTAGVAVGSAVALLASWRLSA